MSAAPSVARSANHVSFVMPERSEGSGNEFHISRRPMADLRRTPI